MNDYDAEHQRGVSRLEAELAEKTATIQTACEWGGEAFLELARRRAAALTLRDAPQEFRVEGFLRLGIIEAFDGNPEEAVLQLEEARRLAIGLEDYERASLAMRLVTTVTEDPDEAAEARSLEQEYKADSARYGSPERFKRFEFDQD